MASGRLVGMVCGMLLMVVLGQCVLFASVSFGTSLAAGAYIAYSKSNGLAQSDSAVSDFLGTARQLQKDWDDDWDDYDHGEWNRSWGWLRYANWIILLGGWLIFSLVSVPAALIYWKLYIEPTYDRHLVKGMIMPQELMGSFKYGLFDFSGACSTCLCFMFCLQCAMGDLWYRAGHSHAISGNQNGSMEGCHGWQFFLGCCGCCMLAEAVGCFSCCAMASLTSGMGWMNQEGGGRSGMGSVVPFRERFGIHSDFNSFCEDCCLWCWCTPCQATREWQQINDALKQWPLPMPQAPPSMVVGQPVVLQAVPVDPKADPKMQEMNPNVVHSPA